MAFQVSFSQKILYDLLKKEIRISNSESKKANALLFQPIFSIRGEIINVEAWAMYHNASKNSHTVRIKKLWPGRTKYDSKPPVESLTGQAGDVTNLDYNNIDELVNSIHRENHVQDPSNPITVYGLVLFHESQISQVFKDANYGTEAQVGSDSKFLRLEHTLIDFGSIIGSGAKKCRTCINLLAKGPGLDIPKPAVFMWGGNDSISIQFGHPCPPDWWAPPDPLPPTKAN